MNDNITYNVIGVFCNTTYYYRVRGYDDSCGVTSGNSNTIIVSTPACLVYCAYKSTCNGNITDSRDNKTYKTIQIGTQCWMAENLNVGMMIPGVAQQTPGPIEKYCYGDDINNCHTYGGLYQWNHMMAYGLSVTGDKGPQGICPAGWHLPTDNERKCLEMTLGMSQTEADKIGYRGTNEGNKLKTQGNGTPPLWGSPSAGTGTSGFSALPGGIHLLGYTKYFDFQGAIGYWWTATESDATNAWYLYLEYTSTQVYRGGTEKAKYGHSVRCVKDSI